MHGILIKWFQIHFRSDACIIIRIVLFFVHRFKWKRKMNIKWQKELLRHKHSNGEVVFASNQVDKHRSPLLGVRLGSTFLPDRSALHCRNRVTRWTTRLACNDDPLNFTMRKTHHFKKNSILIFYKA